MGNNITQKLKYKESVIKFSYKYGVTKAAIKFGECRKTIYRWRKRHYQNKMIMPFSLYNKYIKFLVNSNIEKLCKLVYNSYIEIYKINILKGVNNEKNSNSTFRN